MAALAAISRLAFWSKAGGHMASPWTSFATVSPWRSRSRALSNPALAKAYRRCRDSGRYIATTGGSFLRSPVHEPRLL